MSVTYRPKVFDDLLNLSYYISQDSLEAANRFLDACDETFLQIAKMPSIGKRCDFQNSLLKGIRMWFVKGFEKHLSFYLAKENEIEIVRVLHSARDLENILSEEKP